MTEIQTQVSGLIPQIRQTQIELLKYNTRLLEAKQALESSDIYKNIKLIESMIKEAEEKEKELREQGKNIMIQSGLHDFTTLDGVKVQLNKTPGSIKIEEGFECPEEYKRIKTEIDKTKLKKDYIDGKFYDDKITIDVDYKLIIKD